MHVCLAEHLAYYNIFTYLHAISCSIKKIEWLVFAMPMNYISEYANIEACNETNLYLSLPIVFYASIKQSQARLYCCAIYWENIDIVIISNFNTALADFDINRKDYNSS